LWGRRGSGQRGVAGKRERSGEDSRWWLTSCHTFLCWLWSKSLGWTAWAEKGPDAWKA